jgi:proteasome activator subunit 4
LKAKSDLAISDLEALVSTALKLILCSTDNLFVQQRWGHCLAKILRKYRHKLDLKIEWRPLYGLLMNVHFERRHSYEGYASKRSHLHTMISLVRKSRRFFPSGSAAEIWMEFRPALEDISHNSALEAMGFLSLLLPSPQKKTEDVAAFYSSAWMNECLGLWDALPHCNYWSFQWASIVGRCIKYAANMPLDWEPFLRRLYMHYLRTFEVPVGKSNAWPPIYRGIPREVLNAFYSRVSPIQRVVGRSIVYLLTPARGAQTHLESLIDLLEQYYHPSNGGSWTNSLERFLRFLVHYFMKRISREQM